MKRKIFAAGGYSTVYMGSGRPEFDPQKPQRGFEEYLKEAASGCVQELGGCDAFDEGVISNFMAPRYLRQGHVCGFLPMCMPSLLQKPCTATEAACGSGGRAIHTACRILASGEADAVFVIGFEIQNTMKAVYGADCLASAGYYNGQRKTGYAHFFPGLFADRTGAYMQKYGENDTRKGLARWFENAILNARKSRKAQEHTNALPDPYTSALTPPNAAAFVPHINYFDCSKVTDGSSAIGLFSEEGLKRFGVERKKAVEIVGIGAAEGDISKKESDPCVLSQTKVAGQKAKAQARIENKDLRCLEVHDCFSTSGMLSLEALGFCKKGEGPAFLEEKRFFADGQIPTNLSGGLCGFGHPVGASGVRQLVDLWAQLTGRADHLVSRTQEHAMMVSMGGNDISVTALVVRSC